MIYRFFCALCCILLFCQTGLSQESHSVARQWNEALLGAIRGDFARPTVHARNLFHTSVAFYDAWAAYDADAETYMLGKRLGDYQCELESFPLPTDIDAARTEAMSYAAYRLLRHRFTRSPNAFATLLSFDNLMDELGYSREVVSTAYQNGDPAALGNYLAQCLIEYGALDYANEEADYGNLYYEPINPPLVPRFSGNPDLVNPNRWQPLTLQVFIDQSGNLIPGDTPTFLSPEWGSVTPFALSATDRKILCRDSDHYLVYHDPGPPPMIEYDGTSFLPEEYKWGFALVAAWSAHLDPADGVMWDISPASVGNIAELPASFEDYRSFYNLEDGGDPSEGWAVNPVTGQPYTPQIIPRGDYARVLAEFWADGPDSETPPGHWFTILNYVSDHPLFEKRFRGNGPIIDDLEWDVKSYFLLGGAMHDAAVTAWGIKGFYDYLRPVSAIRWMADNGQSTSEDLPSYHPDGIPLIPGYIELVEAGDSLLDIDASSLGKIKLKAWRGPDYIGDPASDIAGVDWILAEDWWPYQRPSFITPPFAGYISGHSTFSRAAAEVMTMLTGDEFFPGGMGEFDATANEFLVFEDGPSTDLTLQWATYRDASDQTSLSRIWGGIHPPADDIPGRLIGIDIGHDAFARAEQYFDGVRVDPSNSDGANNELSVKLYPNPIRNGNQLNIDFREVALSTQISVYNILGQVVLEETVTETGAEVCVALNVGNLAPGIYFVRMTGVNLTTTQRLLVLD